MKFEEVLPALREGKKIRRSLWEDYHYIQRKLTFLFKIIVNENNMMYTLFLDDLEADDWEILYDEENCGGQK